MRKRLLVAMLTIASLTGGAHASYVAPIGSPIKFVASTVAGLPPCAAGSQGWAYLATDLLTPTALGIAVGGGAVIAPVVCNGTNWVTVL